MEIIGNKKYPEGKNEIIKSVNGFKYPLKIVFAVENDVITVITCYPLKKERKWRFFMMMK